MRKVIFGLVVLGAACALAPATVEADITRGCNAEYRLQYLLVDGGKLIQPQSLRFGRFTSVGRCRGRSYANDCRRRARSYAMQCFNAHWNQRWNRTRPGQCVGGRGGAGVRNYQLADLKTQIERSVCFGPGARSFNREVVVQVRGSTWGDTRCGGEVQISEYRVTREMCGEVDWKGAGGD